MDVDEAFAQLNKSERGRQAIMELKQLCDNGGYGLDPNNLQALSSIFSAMRQDDGFRDVRRHLFQIPGDLDS
jgi:hypothetical protein